MFGLGLTKDSWLGYAAALWSMVFAVLHLAWAAGWYVGLELEQARKAFEGRWLLVYDLAIAGMCVVGVCLALSFVQPWGRRLPRWLVGLGGWGAAGLLVLRGAGSIVQMAYFVVIGKGGDIVNLMTLWEVGFYLGGVLFVLSFLRFRRTSPAAG